MIKKTLLIAAFLFAITNTFAANAGYIKFISSKGKISLVNQDKSRNFTPKKTQIPVKFNEVIRTNSQAHVKLFMFDGNYQIDIYPNTLYKINKPTKEKNIANLFLGKIFFSINKTVKKLFGKEFEVRTKFSTMGVKGTSGILQESRNETTILLEEGVVTFSNKFNPDTVIDVPAGTKSTVKGKNPPTAPQTFTKEELQQTKNKEPANEESDAESENLAEPDANEDDTGIIDQELLDNLNEINDVLEQIEESQETEKSEPTLDVLIQINL